MARDGGGGRAAAPDVGQDGRPGWRRIGAATLGFEPLGSKLRPARPHLDLVERRALLAMLARFQEPLILVSAPAGAGKSMTLMQWVDRERRPTSWLALDEGDNDLATFTRYLALSLAEVAPVDPAVFELLARPRPPVRERVVPRLAASLSEAPPFLLVVDDGHLVRRRECWQVFGAVLNAVPDGAQLALGAREDPPLPLGRLRAAGGLAEVRMDGLAMDEEETAELLRLQGVVMTDGEVKTTFGATEGWPAGVYLATLVAHTLPAGEWPSHIRGDQVEIARYLTDEVLRRVAANTRDFLIRTSILEPLRAGVCAAVTGRADAGALLARIAKKNLFVSALDDHGECFRYHQLFAELLRADLERREPREVPRLHNLAAEWYAAHDDPEAAVVHWLAAGNVTAAVDLAKDACARLHRQEPDLDVGLSVRLLRLIDDRYLKRDPATILMAGWCLGLVGGDHDEQRRWGPAACQVQVGEGPCEAGAASWRSYQAILRCYLGLHGVSRMLEDAELGWQLEADSGNGWRLEAASALGLARYLSGRGGAVGLLEAAATGDWDNGDRAWAWGMLSLVHADECHWQAAAEADHQAVDVEAESNLGFETSDGSPAVLAPVLAHARILSRRRDPDVRAFLEKAERYVRRMVPRADHALLLAAVILGETWLEQADLAQAGRWCDEAHTILRRYPDAGMLGPRARRLAVAIDERRFEEPLTAAEKRVLELLPTHLTAEQIGERLFLSVNTVNTHMRAIHRKLDVASRAEAVVKARELGLLSAAA